MENAEVRNADEQQRAPQSQPKHEKNLGIPIQGQEVPSPASEKMSHSQVGTKHFQGVFGKLPIKVIYI